MAAAGAPQQTTAEGQGESSGSGPTAWAVPPLAPARRHRGRPSCPPLDKGGKVLGALPPPGGRDLQAMARRAGLPESVARGLSGHSARIGARN